MKLGTFALAIAALGGIAAAPAVQAQAQEQFIPLLVYRTGQFAPLGIPWADGKQDYLKLVNAKGGVNGVKIAFEECETAYDTAKGVECYERLKNKGSGASGFDTQSTGITFATSDKAPGDKVPLVTMGYGLSQSADGRVFEWNFPLLGNYWTAADSMIQDILKKEKGSLKGKKIALVYHDSPYGKEPIRTLEELAKKHGFTLTAIPVDHPGQEQKSQWLQIRRERPDYVLMWGWGVMNQVAIQEAANIRFPMENFIGIWWAGSEIDVLPAGDGANGYKALTFNGVGSDYPLYADLKTHVLDTGKASQGGQHVGSAVYSRGMYAAVVIAEAIRKAQELAGTAAITPEQLRDGFEQLDITPERLVEIGLPDFGPEIKLSCQNHGGSGMARIQQWDATAKKWNLITEFTAPDAEVLDPLVAEDAAAYAKENHLTERSCN